MKTLGIDSTAQIGFVSLVENGEITAEYMLNSKNTHSTTLLPMIESLLSVNSLAPSDIDLYAIAAGPGSFTGVRIGAATLKGLAFLNRTPCIGVSSLEAMAEPYRSVSGLICPVINARRSTVYTALFETDGESVPKRIFDDCTLSEDELCSLLTEKYMDKELYFTGDSAKEMAEKIKEKFPEAKVSLLQNRAGTGAALAAERIFISASEEEKAGFTPENLSPVYLKKPQAEREREERLAALQNNTVSDR